MRAYASAGAPPPPSGMRSPKLHYTGRTMGPPPPPPTSERNGLPAASGPLPIVPGGRPRRLGLKGGLAAPISLRARPILPFARGRRILA